MKFITMLGCLLLALTPVLARDLPPLTVHDVGEYGAVPWEVPEGPIVPGSRADRVRDLNFAVSSVNIREDEIKDEVLQRWAKAADLGAAQRKKFLPRVYFWDGADRYKGPMRDVEVYWQRLDRFLGAMDLKDFTGIVLAEENVSYSGRPEVLAELYRRIKSKYDVAVWQWWSPSSAVPGSGGWIPADGWVIDVYHMPQDAFRRYLRKYLITGLPIVVMPWASADEEITEEQWQANTDQLDVAVEFNLPVAFYWVSNHTCYFDGSRDAKATLTDRINQWVWQYIDRTKTIPRDYTGQASADSATGQAREIGPTEEDKFVYSDDFSTSRCVDEAWMSGFRDLVLDGQTLCARGFLGRRTSATLSYEFAGDFAVRYPQVSLDVQVDPARRGRVKLTLAELTKEGPAPSTQVTTDQTVVLTSARVPAFSETRRFRLKIEMSGDAGDDQHPPCRIDNLRVSAPLVPPTEFVARLAPSAGGGLAYEDTFDTRKYLYATTRTGDEKLEWSEGELAVRLQPGGSAPALTWKVVADRPVGGIKIEVENRANNGSLGTNHYLQVSLDGQTWTDAVSTEGMDKNISGWTGAPLVIDLAGRPEYASVRAFYVRLQMKANGYKERHPARSGIVSRLRITASGA